jgi:hypothetical protein
MYGTHQRKVKGLFIFLKGGTGKRTRWRPPGVRHKNVRVSQGLSNVFKQAADIIRFAHVGGKSNNVRAGLGRYFFGSLFYFGSIPGANGDPTPFSGKLFSAASAQAPAGSGHKSNFTVDSKIHCTSPLLIDHKDGVIRSPLSRTVPFYPP